jgi:AraC-like DNA-binding protein
MPIRSPLRKANDGTGPAQSAPVAGIGDQGKITSMSFLRAAMQSHIAAGGRPTLAHTAEMVGVGPRTLQRQLCKIGVSFATLLDQCRFDTAARLLSDPGNPIIDIAMAIGYDDQSHFTRAFRRISGMTPMAYRAAVIAEHIDRPDELDFVSPDDFVGSVN